MNTEISMEALEGHLLLMIYNLLSITYNLLFITYNLLFIIYYFKYCFTPVTWHGKLKHSCPMSVYRLKELTSMTSREVEIILLHGAGSENE